MSRIPTPRLRSLTDTRGVNRLVQSMPEIRGGGGTLVSRTSNRITVEAETQPYPMFPVMPVRIVSSVSVGPNRWEYQVQRVTKRDHGYALLEAFESDYDGTAYNTLEIGNSGSGVQGNGINVDDLPTGFTLGPAPSGQFAVPAFVWVTDTSDQTPELWFTYSNPVVGVCR